ncbi:KICSTOR complex protein SZT2-like isoform X2 [Belonocnema kinseyi]|uniref:KICSTOR complex protein SZT2-like isoform X2 n=1 Tax=Belonocnema kinseyi TaxID=2817044 RepID=UPI00143DDD9A|nr:KICSTOR complex protein SZT2-like isoform X2 [Belonocnema kinseyi]
MDYPEVEAKLVLEAETVFLLMKKGFPISRNVRAQWKIEHLDTVVAIQETAFENEETPELEIVSVVPKEIPASWSADNSHKFFYRISSTTSLIFLAHKYRMVFSLDLSPSLATIDVQNGQVVIDEVCQATKRCLEGITRPFIIPGSTRLMKPEIYVTVIAHTPFFSNPAQQVLVQGWLVTMGNLGSLMHFIEKQLSILEEKVAQVTGVVNQQLEHQRAESERLVGGLFEEGGTSIGNNNNNNNSNNMSSMSMVSPETSFVNMVRYGMLALSLLPDHSCAHLVIVTDGIIGVTDANVMDSVIQQLRATTVACSFLHVGSSYHPHCANGLVPYEDILIFLATATLGTYFSFIPQPIPNDDIDMNIYHRNFFCWQLYRALCYEKGPLSSSDWHMKKFLFHGDDFPHILRKKQIDEKVKCTLSSLLCCRLREGYMIKTMNLREDCLEICFVLPWKTHVFLEFSISCPWQKRSMAICNTITYTITIGATYEFLHDITCLSKKPLKSQYRQRVVSRFWAALTSLTESDNMLSHFSWSPGLGWTWYNVPDTIKSGMPVFYLPTYPSASITQLSDAACPQFGQIWQPVVSLEPQQWARWMHCQRVTLVLCHDKPLPKHLHQANQSGRFQSVQYRQAAAALYGMLKNWATFVLVDNHTYVQFIYREIDKPPVSFSLINVNCRALCMVLNIAFAGGTEGVVRHNVLTDLRERLSKLTLPSRPTDQRETPCCTIIHKALEKILIRYERMPTDLSTVKFPDGTQLLPRNSLISGGNLTSTLSRYLYHGRWLWFVRKPFVQTIPAISLPRLNIAAIARILSTITKIRLSEGFNFAYSAAGIINMVREVQMRGPENDSLLYPCTIQYILFPPHVVINPAIEQDTGSEDTDEGTGDGEGGTEDCESSGDFEIVTEIWVEPQCGHVQIPPHHKAAYMNSLQYHQLPDAIAHVDEECINALLTLEHLSLLSQIVPSERSLDIMTGQGYLNQGMISRPIKKPTQTDFLEGPPSVEERIHSMVFLFDTLNILPKCQQAELLFSMFDDGLHNADHEEENANRILIDGFLDHIKNLHNKELLLTTTESQKFTEMIANRSRDEESHIPYFHTAQDDDKTTRATPQWRCFVKGVSTTHVILSILPATEKDVRLLMYPEEDVQDLYLGTDSNLHYESLNSNFDLRDTNLTPVPYGRSQPENDCASPNQNFDDFGSSISSRTTTAHSTPKPEAYPKVTEENPKRGLILPIYVYDCSLALLIDSLVEKLPSPRAKDVFRDYTFRIGEHFQEEFINLKSAGDTKPSSPEPKSEDSDNVLSDQKSLMEHCKTLSLAHCRCYVMAVYKSLILQRPLSYEDIEAAVEQCEENYMEINITDYLRSVCKHLSTSSEENLDSYSGPTTCSDIQSFHNLIKNKFERIINVAFRPVPAHPEFYFCLPSWPPERIDPTDSQNTDSDDELEGFTFHSEGMDCKMNSCSGKVNPTSVTWPVGKHTGPKLSSSHSTESFISDLHIDTEPGKEHPLFLQLNCSVRNRSSLSSTPVKLLPTCVTEIMQNFDDYGDHKVTLDIICLYLPKEVLEVSSERLPGLRTTSFCSASPHGSLRTEHSNSFSNGADFSEVEAVQAGIAHLPLYQYAAITHLKEEIDWLLQDETATALLDKSSPNEDTLNFVARHVSESNDRTSCYTEKVPLHFVFPSQNSVPKFLEELTRLEIDRYCIRQEGSLFYFVKNLDPHVCSADSSGEQRSEESVEQNVFEGDEIYPEVEKPDSNQGSEGRPKKQDSGDPPGYLSEISSIGDGQIGTDDGYDGDSSDSEDECQWLIEMDKRRKLLPNFWLILRVETTHVNVYFHCRFLELASSEVAHYQQIQKLVVAQIKAICRRVNQYLLLHRLNDTRLCDSLLEPESSEDHNWKADSFSEGSGIIQNHNTAMNVTPGMFRCPVVWEMPFCLHPRLKTGPGRSGLSRGIKALHGVLNRLSVNNRSNMFVYRENNDNVFYLRLHEQTSDGKSLQNKLSESDERLVVSRSSSIASLSQVRGTSLLNEIILDDTRPRVRSFGERESDVLSKSGDSIVLMVHGISEAGPEIRCELVQVLQNRLDDAVLEVLSVMLARNPMCKLTPADVHFIQKPYRSPESVVRLTVQPHCLTHMCALGYYLRQNVLQFLYIPKHTDPRAHYHFQDYSQPESSAKRISESEIFLYNQTQSSGSRGIACIAMGIVNAKGELIATQNDAFRASPFSQCPRVQDFEKIVLTSVHDDKSEVASDVEALIEFRIWKQGRVNLEALVQKLKSAVRHAIWDLVTEYNLLPTVLTVPLKENVKEAPSAALQESGNRISLDLRNENLQSPRKEGESGTETPQPSGSEFVQSLVAEILNNSGNEVSQDNSESSEGFDNKQYDLGEEGKLHQVYHAILPYWFQFALEMNVPAVKKHVVTLQKRHSLSVTLRELQNIIRSNASDTSTRTFVQSRRQPFVESEMEEDPLAFTVFEGADNVNNVWLKKAQEQENENEDESVYLPCDFFKEEQGIYVKSILVARNFQQWKASFARKVESEQLVPKDQKLLQKFNPLILESNFVPRQRLLLAKIQSKNIVLYMYNWSKERSEKLVKQATNLGTWLSSRSTLYSNIIMQKLGIFHHQPTEQADIQYSQVADMENLAKFTQASPVRTQSGKNSFSWNHFMGQVMRDAKPSGQHPPNTTDPVVKAAHDFHELRHREKKKQDELNRLYTMWQSRSTVPNIPISSMTLNTFKQHSRLLHYCHTPLLFLPSWRLQSAATRDHSLTPSSSNVSDSLAHLKISIHKSQNRNSGGNNYVINEWHRELCAYMLSEYKQYLQILGFNPVHTETSHRSDRDNLQNQTFYLKKSMLGGVLLFEIHLSEPFFTVKLRVIECSRLQLKTSPLVNQFLLSFVDACDKIKINMHLHSFTYDFHLRSIHSYIAGTGHWSLRHGYHLTHFLDDFNKYYSKAPNYARNLVYSGVITLSNLATPARTLYSYLLSHEKAYGMQVFSMSDESEEGQDSEYVLVKLQSTPLVSYCDAQDTKYTDDFDVALIVSRLDEFPHSESNEITLKYYLMLTSKRELYPKRDLENNKLGKFRTVYSVGKSLTNSQVESPAESSPASTLLSSSRKHSKCEFISSTIDLREETAEALDAGAKTEDEVEEKEAEADEEDLDNPLAPTPPPVPDCPLTQSILDASSSNLLQIRQESINYLGYYSSHEQLMQQLIMSQAQAAREHITSMIEQGALHCRTHLLWNKLLESKSTMSLAEFTELRSLSCVEPLSSLDSRLDPLVNQPVTWYQALAKVLQNKYQEYHKQFNTPDGNVTHHLILHPSYVQAFMMLTIDLHTSRGELCAVYRKSVENASSPFSVGDVYNLVEGFVNACCFHLWMGLYN